MYLDIKQNFIEDNSSSLEKENIFSAKPSQIISTLAWAIKCQIPLGQALLTLRTRNYRKRKFNLNIWPKRKHWNRDLTNAAEALDNGFPVSEALRYLKLYFPPYLLPALKEAEKNNALDKVLPVASHQLRYSSGVLKERILCFIFPVFFFVQIMAFISGFCVFIIPKFERILDEMCGGMPLPGLTSFLFKLAPFATPLIGIIQLAIPSLIIFIIFYRLEPTFRFLADFFLLQLPFLGKDFKRMALLDFTSSMACLTAAGYDIIPSAELTKEALRSYWIRKKVDRFIEKIQNGSNWIDAWDEMKLGFPLYNWIARNSASQEKLPEGLMLITKWLKNDISNFSTFFIKSIHIIGFLLNTLLVAVTVIGMGYGLFNITYVLVRKILI